MRELVRQVNLLISGRVLIVTLDVERGAGLLKGSRERRVSFTVTALRVDLEVLALDVRLLHVAARAFGSRRDLLLVEVNAGMAAHLKHSLHCFLAIRMIVRLSGLAVLHSEGGARYHTSGFNRRLHPLARHAGYAALKLVDVDGRMGPVDLELDFSLQFFATSRMDLLFTVSLLRDNGRVSCVEVSRRVLLASLKASYSLLFLSAGLA